MNCRQLFLDISVLEFWECLSCSHLEMSAFALAFKDVSIEDVCMCIYFSVASFLMVSTGFTGG